MYLIFFKFRLFKFFCLIIQLIKFNTFSYNIVAYNCSRFSFPFMLKCLGLNKAYKVKSFWLLTIDGSWSKVDCVFRLLLQSTEAQMYYVCCVVFVGPNRCKLQDMLANLRDAEDLSSIQPPVAPPARPSLPRLNEHQLGRTDEGKSLTLHHQMRLPLCFFKD